MEARRARCQCSHILGPPHSDVASMVTPKIAVIIPFFQRQTGILGRALQSIADQQYPNSSLYVIVVDDGSPISAESEVMASRPSAGLRVTVIRQANAGPNEARNTGLKNLEPGTSVVAYLDSDDEWVGDHLARAVKGLALGYTAYFANLYHLGDDIDEFTKAKRVHPPDHPMVDGDPTLRAYQGDMVHQIATANIIFMPSLVIDSAALGEARFPLAHRHGGGDYLYWMHLIQHGAKFVFSTLPEVRCGRGINMWYGSGWGTDGLAMRIVDEARFRRKVLTQHASAPATKDNLRNRLTELQVGMILDSLHRIRRGKKVNWKVMRLFFLENAPNMPMLVKLTRLVFSRFGSK